MSIKDLNFLGSDPGAVKFGNFINYYSFHKVEERTNNLQPEMFITPTTPEDSYICLDVGCNSGELTNELYHYLKGIFPYNNIHILAIDIDPLLILRAQESLENKNITFRDMDIMNEENHILIKNFLISHQKQTFDVIFCFSVTMWIHLNNGDEGLLKFLNYIKSISRSIVIEPQPWNCYRNAQRRVKKSGKTFALYESLKIRSNVDYIIEEKIEDNRLKKIYESPNSRWKRKIQSYQIMES